MWARGPGWADLKSKEIKQLISFTDFPVLSASSGGGKIIYEQAGYLHGTGSDLA